MPDQVIHTITDFYQSRNEVLFGYLFGSYAQNRHHSGSDVDIAIFLSNYNTDTAHEFKMADITALQDIMKKTVDLIIFNIIKTKINAIEHGLTRIRNYDYLALEEFLTFAKPLRLNKR